MPIAACDIIPKSMTRKEMGERMECGKIACQIINVHKKVGVIHEAAHATPLGAAATNAFGSPSGALFKTSETRHYPDLFVAIS